MTAILQTPEEPLNETAELSLYGLRSISGASYLGGPMAAAYLISENFKALGNPEKAKRIFFFGIVFTIAILGGALALPEPILDRLPNYLIPLSYTLAYYFYAQAQLGTQIERHKALGNTFYPWWRVFGIGLVSLAMIFAFLFAALLLSEEDLPEAYQTEMEQFSANEIKSLDFYDRLEIDPPFKLMKDLETLSIPLWEENIAIVERCMEMEGLGPETLDYTKKLLAYSKTRLEIFETFQMALLDPRKDYNPELDVLHEQLNQGLKDLE